MAKPRQRSAILRAALAFVLVVGAAIQISRSKQVFEAVHQWADLLPVMPVVAASFLCSVFAIFVVRRALSAPGRPEGQSADETDP
jgi:hypothetical protein